MWKVLTTDSILSYALVGMTTVTGLVDAVSFLSLGHVFTANMTGNIVLLAFASTSVPQMSLAGSITALLGFLAGAGVGGRIMAGASAFRRTVVSLQPRVADIVAMPCARNAEKD